MLSFEVSSRLRSIVILIKINIDDLISENMKKMEAKRAKEGLPPQKITNQAHQSAKNINKPVINKGSSGIQWCLRQEPRRLKLLQRRARMQNRAASQQRPNLVKDFDERNKKK